MPALLPDDTPDRPSTASERHQFGHEPGSEQLTSAIDTDEKCLDPGRSRLVDTCYEMAVQGYDEGGIPIASILVRDGVILGSGRNRRVQSGDPTAHGEMDCLRNAGRMRTYRGTTLFTSLSPCMMCCGTIVQFKIPHVVIAENLNFGGNEEFLRDRGVKVEILNDPRCIGLMRRFIDENPELWREDIAD